MARKAAAFNGHSGNIPWIERVGLELCSRAVYRSLYRKI